VGERSETGKRRNYQRYNFPKQNNCAMITPHLRTLTTSHFLHSNLGFALSKNSVISVNSVKTYQGSGNRDRVAALAMTDLRKKRWLRCRVHLNQGRDRKPAKRALDRPAYNSRKRDAPTTSSGQGSL